MLLYKNEFSVKNNQNDVTINVFLLMAFSISLEI